jgi:hypothetical protein
MMPPVPFDAFPEGDMDNDGTAEDIVDIDEAAAV